jgi:hypothetical protein
VTSTSAPAITDAQMVTVVVTRALPGLTGEGGGETLRCTCKYLRGDDGGDPLGGGQLRQ